MSNIAKPPSQPQNNPDSQGPPSPGQAPAPEVQTRTSLAVTPVPVDSFSTATTLDHDHQFPSQATTHHQQLQLDSEHHHLHQHHLHHVVGSTPASAPGLAQSHSQHQNQLEAANIAHFDALGHDFDKQNPFSAEFADRLSKALRRLSPSRSAGGSSNDNAGSLVLDEDATSVLDYACGSGTCSTPIFASAWCSDKGYCCRLYFYFLYAGQISRALAPYVAQLVGVDISPRMVEVYNTCASTQGLEPHEMRAVSSLAELQQQRFDLAVVSHR